jgi:carboxymethylenebutenolidase
MDGHQSQIRSLTPPTDFTRRGILVTGIAAGFALAVQPVAAATITTDSNGLTAGEVKVPVADGEIPAYRAMPASGGPFPTVVVIHEIFGVHQWVQDVCRRFAKLGYFAVSPNLYARQGDVSKLADIPTIIREVVSKVPDPEVASDVDAAIAWAKTTGMADTARLGVTGFCWGGRETWLYVAHNPQVKAAVAWYGPLARNPNAPGTPAPLDVVAEITTPVLGLYGAADSGIPVPLVERMRSLLKEAHKEAEIVIYPEAPHGFFADYRASYRPEAAADGWKRLQAWFKDHGV